MYPTDRRNATFAQVFMGRSLDNSSKKFVSKSCIGGINGVESLDPRQKPKIRLPNEEIMFDVEKLYHNW